MSQNLLLLMNGTLSEVLIQLRIGDLDSLNHVNNANYLTFFEIGRVDFLIKLIKIFDPRDVNFVVKHAEIEFKKPIHFTDKPVVQTWISKIGNTSVVFSHKIIDKENSDVYANGKTVVVWIDGKGQKIPIPDNIRNTISNFVNEDLE